MQALTYTAPNHMALREVPAPMPEAGSQRLRVHAVGICGSELHAFKAHDPQRVPPMVLGHEFVGTALDGALAGQRFTANPIFACGHCRYCHQGRTNLCSHRRMIGMNLPGAFAQELRVPDSCLVPVPATLPDAAAAPGSVVAHVGLGDWASSLDWRALTLREITLVGCYTDTTADRHTAVAALAAGSFGDLAWVEERALSAGAEAFDDLVAGRVAAAKIVLRPGA